MAEFKVIITRSAVETVVLNVQGCASQEEADELIEQELNGVNRVDVNDLTDIEGVTVYDRSCTGDEESSWEVSL